MVRSADRRLRWSASLDCGVGSSISSDSGFRPSIRVRNFSETMVLSTSCTGDCYSGWNGRSLNAVVHSRRSRDQAISG